MTRLEKNLSRLNFKKLAVWYIILAVTAGLACVGAVGWIYRERLGFAWQYSRIDEAKSEEALRSAVDKTAAASTDVVDILIIDGDGNVEYSASDSALASDTFTPARIGDEKKYLAAPECPSAVFRYVKSEEFMLRSIISRDFGSIRSDYDDDSAVESDISSRDVYMLSRLKIRSCDRTVYVITAPTDVPGGMLALKLTAVLAMLFFCIYWVLIALWMYADAAKHGMSSVYWGLIGLLTNLVGLIVYKIYKHGLSVCPACGLAQPSGHIFCSHCGGRLGRCCDSCGTRVGARDSFCHRCGSPLDSEKTAGGEAHDGSPATDGAPGADND